MVARTRQRFPQSRAYLDRDARLTDTEPQFPSSARALRELDPSYQALITSRFLRIWPVLLLLLKLSDISARNRTWPGVSPVGKAVTSLLTIEHWRKARRIIDEYAAAHGENAEALKRLVRAYCQDGLIGLAEVLPSSLPPLVASELQELADFHRLAKHPRADAGIFIRELLDCYAKALDIPPLSPFVARYAWASNRYIERWYIGESGATEHVAKTARRRNLNLPYPHQRWHLRVAPLPFQVLLSRRHPKPVMPWMCWCEEELTDVQMGFRVTPTWPTPQDVSLTIRWSIWHFEAPWWKARGAPDELTVPPGLDMDDANVQRALSYTRTIIRRPDPPEPHTDLEKWPEKVVAWIQLQVQRQTEGSLQPWTIAEVRAQLLELMHDAMQVNSFARATPSILAEQRVSLPWSTGIAASLFLPSAGTYRVCNRLISPWGVPFDLTGSILPEGKEVDVRYDPDDARTVYAVYDGSRVARASALAFEHGKTWLDLVDDSTVFSRYRREWVDESITRG